MTYSLEFHEAALREWRKLGNTVQEQFKRKLQERLENPHVPASLLRASRNRYKIKLRNSGYRLVYEVHDVRVVVQVIAVGRRERNQVYAKAAKR
ncbi:MAG: type II toxin-antitoxin system RelE family toxin [Pseudorhodobacter sp.]